MIELDATQVMPTTRKTMSVAAGGSATTVVDRPLAALRPDPGNPRLHSRAQVKAIARSIEAFGFNVPVLIDAQDRIVAGHGRVAAATLLGRATVPTIMLRHLTPAQASAFMIADNRLTDTSTWDDRLLAEQLRSLADLDLTFSLEATGFSMGEIDFRIEGLGDAIDGEADADDRPIPAADVAVTRAGDLWQLGTHRLLCGSALDAAAYTTLLAGDRAAMVFTDPPYNVKIGGHVSGLGRIRHREFAMASGEMDGAAFTAFLTDACRLMAQHSERGALHYLCMDWRHLGELLAAGGAVYDSLRNVCVWAKDQAGMGSLYRSAHELVLVFRVAGGGHRNNVELGRHGRHRTNVWHYPGIAGFRRGSDDGDLLALHPTVKPVRMVADAILDCTARGDLILDPFLGSGTTLLAAARMGRRSAGIELDPLYVDTAVRRWVRLTGDTPILAATGETFDAVAARREGEGIGAAPDAPGAPDIIVAEPMAACSWLTTTASATAVPQSTAGSSPGSQVTRAGAGAEPRARPRSSPPRSPRRSSSPRAGAAAGSPSSRC